MLTVLAYLLLALLVAVSVILAIAARRPDRFHSARTLRIAAPRERLYPLIESLSAMNTWNPFALRETGGSGTYSGPERGKDARYDFAGPKSGTGWITVTDTVPLSKVVLRLVMTKPFQADNTVEFTLVPSGSGTDVTWAMSGSQPLLAKAMTLFVDCDKMVGREFEAGLANLKAIAERG